MVNADKRPIIEYLSRINRKSLEGQRIKYKLSGLAPGFNVIKSVWVNKHFCDCVWIRIDSIVSLEYFPISDHCTKMKWGKILDVHPVEYIDFADN